MKYQFDIIVGKSGTLTGTRCPIQAEAMEFARLRKRSEGMATG